MLKDLTFKTLFSGSCHFGCAGFLKQTCCESLNQQKRDKLQSINENICRTISIWLGCIMRGGYRAFTEKKIFRTEKLTYLLLTTLVTHYIRSLLVVVKSFSGVFWAQSILWMVNSLATGGHRQEYKKDWHLWKIIDVCVSFKRSFWTILNFSSGHVIIYA